VDHDQRYCVFCGTHRRHVKDPAARYLSQTTARARASSAAALRQATPARRRWSSTAIAILVAVVLAAAAIGVLIGRSTAGGTSAPPAAHSNVTNSHRGSGTQSAGVKREGNATGKDYVQGANALPGTVVVK
jgi:hypothetical protein